MEKITQRQIAQYVGVSDVFIHEVRRGVKRFGIEKLEFISELTNVPVSVLLKKRKEGEAMYELLVERYQEKQWEANNDSNWK